MSCLVSGPRLPALLDLCYYVARFLKFYNNNVPIIENLKKKINETIKEKSSCKKSREQREKKRSTYNPISLRKVIFFLVLRLRKVTLNIERWGSWSELDSCLQLVNFFLSFFFFPLRICGMYSYWSFYLCLISQVGNSPPQRIVLDRQIYLFKQ